jgi:hypothetical protein
MEAELTWENVKDAARRSGRLRSVCNKGGEYELICIQYPDATSEAILQKTDTPADWRRRMRQLQLTTPTQLTLL